MGFWSFIKKVTKAVIAGAIAGAVVGAIVAAAPLVFPSLATPGCAITAATVGKAAGIGAATEAGMFAIGAVASEIVDYFWPG
jgi:hypothetical protein